MPATPLRPIDQLTVEWNTIGRSPEARMAMAALAGKETEIAQLDLVDLAALVERLRRPTGAEGRDRAAHLLRLMLRSQETHPLVARAILQALLPGLVTVARRLSWGSGGDWSDGGAFFADLIATAWEVIQAWAGEDRRYAILDLLSAIRCRMRRQLMRDRPSQELTLAGDLDERLQSRTTRGTTDLDELARAIEELTGNGLDPGDAAVLYGNRVLGFSLAELAQMSGRSRRYLAARRHRAVQHLSA